MRFWCYRLGVVFESVVLLGVGRCIVLCCYHLGEFVVCGVIFWTRMRCCGVIFWVRVDVCCYGAFAAVIFSAEVVMRLAAWWQ